MAETKRKFSKPKTIFLYIMAAVEVAAVIFFVIIFLKFFVVNFFRIDGRSMYPSYKPGDQVMVSRLAYSFGLPDYIYPTGWESDRIRIGLGEVRRGDVVSIYFPVNKKLEHPSIKRVMAISGDSVFFDSEWVGITPPDDRDASAFLTPGPGISIALDSTNFAYYKYAIENECNIAEMIDGVIYINGKKAASYEFGDEYCFVAGDNHALSYDSRDFGFLPEGAILGKAVFKIRSAD